MPDYQDAGGNITNIGYAIESRVEGVGHPNGTLTVMTTPTYDLMGRLVSLDVSLDAVAGATILPSLS